MVRRIAHIAASLLTLAAVSNAGAANDTSELTLTEVRRQRHEAAHQPRRLVFHSDGVAMDPKHAYHEPTPSVIPHLPGTQTDACTYSLIHQFPVVRLYRSEAGQEWPNGISQKLFGGGPDGLDQYIQFCRDQGYEAFWAMRTNDTHDSGRDEHGQNRWNSNRWKQTHPELLFGTRDGEQPKFGGWTAFDYAQPKVREKVYAVVEEVSQNYPIDGILLDFFRHLPTFKSTGWGAKQASDQERAQLTDLMRQLRDLRDRVGAERREPLLLAVRTPDTAEYCRALGIDIETWMRERLIDVWIASGYFRLQEWDDVVRFSHEYDIPVWASIDESRITGRDNRNTLEVYRGRVMNAWRAGVDAIWMFNFFYFPSDPQFQLLREAGEIETLAYTDKIYVPDGRGHGFAKHYLADGASYFRRPKTFQPDDPDVLKPGQSRAVPLRVGDDVSAADAEGFDAKVTLRLQADDVADDLRISLNDTLLERNAAENGWTVFAVSPSDLHRGINDVVISRGADGPSETVLRDLQLAISYHSRHGRQNDKNQANAN